MLFKPNRKHELLLPEIIHVRDVELVRTRESLGDNDHHRKLSGCRINFPDIRKLGGGGYLLPPEYQTLLDYSIFAIDDYYAKVIEDLFLKGRYYWKHHLYQDFDTCLREALLVPAVSFIKCAFDVLADCWYDGDTKWFSRNYPLKHNLDRLMLYRFWAGQAGGAGQWYNAGFDVLKKRLKNYDEGGKEGSSFRCYSDEDIEVIRKMVIDIEECEYSQDDGAKLS